MKTRLFAPPYISSSVDKGIELGLSLSYKIVVERHGGKFYCQSAPEQGTEFVIEIPIQQQVSPAA